MTFKEIINAILVDDITYDIDAIAWMETPKYTD